VVAVACLGTPANFAGGTKGITASWFMNRRTSHTDHLGSGSRYPDGPAIAVALRYSITPSQGVALSPPCLVSTDQRLSIDTFVAQDCPRGLAGGATVLANDDAYSAGVVLAPAWHMLRAMAPGGRKQAGICLVFTIRAYVDDGWCAGKTDKPRELRHRDFGWSGHGGVHSAEDMDAMF
jgi:hypothetical protein